MLHHDFPYSSKRKNDNNVEEIMFDKRHFISSIIVGQEVKVVFYNNVIYAMQKLSLCTKKTTLLNECLCIIIITTTTMHLVGMCTTL